MSAESTSTAFLGKRRWYDQRSELTQCISLLEAFPAEVRTIIADGLVYLAEREFEAHLMLSSLKSLGPEKILGIYKSKNKRRSMDKDPVFHKVMNYFYILSPQNRLFMARLTTDLVTYIYKYFESCKNYSQPVSIEDVTNITRRYVDSGGDEAQHFIETLQRQFRRQLQSAPEPGQGGATPTIQEDDSGLHLRKRQ